MKRSKFSEQQIAFILRQAEEGTSVEEVCRKAGVSIQTYYRWPKKYGGLMPSEMKRLVQVSRRDGANRDSTAGIRLIKPRSQEYFRNLSRYGRFFATPLGHGLVPRMLRSLSK
jgi:putative transposase